MKTDLHVDMQPDLRETSAAVIIRFFEIAAQVHDAARHIHDDEMISVSGHDAAAMFTQSLSTKLASVTEDLGDMLADAKTETNPINVGLVGACRKVALDLIVHVEAVSRLNTGSSNATDTADFRALWSQTDVSALGHRLGELFEAWKDANPTPIDANLLDGLANLKVRPTGNAAERKDEELLEQNERPTQTRNPTNKTPAIEMTAKEKLIAKYRPKPSKPAAPSPSILEDFILESLAYKSMRDREEEVVEAHGKTLDWIFADNSGHSTPGPQSSGNTRFATWLATSTGGPIYWISGKPGSGKSTLMRYLYEHEETRSALQKWAGEMPVATAGFFFWTSGSREQRSQTGLLRYLLHQLLSGDDSRDLIPIAFPTLWSKLSTMTTKERIAYTINWTVAELGRALNTFMNAALERMSVCLFIDGLDEFQGDHKEIIEFFKNLGEKAPDNARGRVKMCLSSRPWNVFEAAFQYSVPNLKLQDLTTEDMRKYAADRLNSDIHFRRLLKRQADRGVYDTFVDELIQRANGVFLWVRLAVDKILQRLAPTDNWVKMETVLGSLPTELDELFEKLLFEEQTPDQISETAILFQLICARELVAGFLKDESSNSLTVWEISFALDTADDAAATDTELVVEEADDADVVARCEATKAHVHARFAGLLEVYSKGRKGKNGATLPRFLDDFANGYPSGGGAGQRLARNKLIYIHRTVRDWLMDTTNSVRERLDSLVPEAFDPHLRLLQSYVLRLKTPLEEPEHHRRLNEWWPDIALAMTHARYVDSDRDISKQLLRPLVNELDRMTSWYWLPKKGNEGDHWARAAFGSYEVRMKAPPIREPFLCLAVKFGLTSYVCGELEVRNQSLANEESEDDDDRAWGPSAPLLTYATEFLCSRALTIYPLSDPKLVDYLLTHQSTLNPGPNHGYVDFNTRSPRTPWLTVLRHLRDARRRGWIEYYDIDANGTARWARIVESLIKLGGADVNAIVAEDGWDPEISALGVMGLLEGTYGAFEVRDLKLLVASETERTKTDTGQND